MSITSEEVNYLVFRYLQESGFQHSAFTFGYESVIHKSGLNGNDVPPGALISFVQKGLQYIELEANLAGEGAPENESATSEFTLLNPEDLLTKEVAELRKTIAVRREQKLAAERKKDKEEQRKQSRAKAGAKRQSEKEEEGKAEKQAKQAKKAEGLAPMEEDEKSEEAAAANPKPFAPEEVRTLKGHSSEVFVCAWNADSGRVASGSGDSTAMIWDVRGDAQPAVLTHHPSAEWLKAEGPQKQREGGGGKNDKDVTTLAWSPSCREGGDCLATGSYDGQARLWDASGSLIRTLEKHEGPIFSIKWNKTGDLLLTGSVDKTSVVWDAATGQAKQQWTHEGAMLDVDWRDDKIFATCSGDKKVYVCELGKQEPLRVYKGHTDEVNAIHWSPCGKLLASCSDDKTAKIWSFASGSTHRLHSLQSHKREVYNIKWRPAGEGSQNPNQDLLLATASFDATVRLWEPEKGTCVRVLGKHTSPVYSVAFSPCGTYLATGSFDKHLHVWSVKDGKCVKSFKGGGGIFEVCWNKDATKVAACMADNNLAVLDFRV